MSCHKIIIGNDYSYLYHEILLFIFYSEYALLVGTQLQYTYSRSAHEKIIYYDKCNKIHGIISYTLFRLTWFNLSTWITETILLHKLNKTNWIHQFDSYFPLLEKLLSRNRLISESAFLSCNPKTIAYTE